MRRTPWLLLLVLFVAGCGSQGSSPVADGSPTPTATPSVSATPTPTATASVTPTPSAISACYPDLDPFDPVTPGPNYEQYDPVVGSHCNGTNNQSIAGIEKVVFLGDSITEGTPPTWPWEVYRSLVTDALRDRFGNGLEVTECAKWGAHTSDFLGGENQLAACFPALPVAKRTLVIFTMGGNDIATFTKAGMDGVPVPEILDDVDIAAERLREAIAWLQDPSKFPSGVSIVFTNNYEFTDGMGDPSVCAAASAAGFGAPWPEGRPVFLRFNEAYLKIAVDTHTDLVFAAERFCGHGFNAQNPAGECYQGPDAETWFDLTCTHPNPTGHARLAELFLAVIDE